MIKRGIRVMGWMASFLSRSDRSFGPTSDDMLILFPVFLTHPSPSMKQRYNHSPFRQKWEKNQDSRLKLDNI